MEVPGRRLALIAKTPADARDYQIEGQGGILNNVPDNERPEYEPSKRRLTWPNGSWATIYSDETPWVLRGFSGDTAWLDEFAKYRHPDETWRNLQMGLRECSADRPRRLITTTPRPIDVLKEIEALRGTITVVGSSYENRSNLDPTWFEETLSQYEGTSYGRQEIHAEILGELPGALWTGALIEATRVPDDPDDIRRLVVAVDPAATSGEKADYHGIVIAGLGGNGHGYILDDVSLRGTPQQACKTAITAYHDWQADAIIAEVNNGGEWIEHAVKQMDRRVGYRAVRASRGKRTRAEPVALLYEKGEIHHVGILPDLEDQMTTWEPDIATKSPDRMDAMVWAITDLMIERKTFRRRRLGI
jgi:predicted phage terminase large subunit-like protein